ncbi:hypothetical protein [Leptospira kirschneri]|uniref:hypothetical protein n=1 Tax=Leptospira kirschneri TaxID=29507 RepID=UPI00046C5CF1
MYIGFVLCEKNERNCILSNFNLIEVVSKKDTNWKIFEMIFCNLKSEKTITTIRRWIKTTHIRNKKTAGINGTGQGCT